MTATPSAYSDAAYVLGVRSLRHFLLVHALIATAQLVRRLLVASTPYTPIVVAAVALRAASLVAAIALAAVLQRLDARRAWICTLLVISLLALTISSPT